MPSWRRGGPPVGLEMGCQCNSKGGPPVGAKESPWPSEACLHGLRHPTLLLRACSPWGQAERRWGGSRWNVCLGMFLGRSALPGQAEAVTSLCLLEVPVGLGPLSPHCCPWPQGDIRPIPEQNPAKQSLGVCAFELVSWAGDGLGAPTALRHRADPGSSRPPVSGLLGPGLSPRGGSPRKSSVFSSPHGLDLSSGGACALCRRLG